MKNLLIGAILGLALTVGSVLAQDCKPSKYGPADEIGAANLVTPERVLAATKLVKQGKSHPLGIVVVPGMPAYPPRSVSLQVVQPNMQFGKSGVTTFGWDIIGNDDLAQVWFGVGPQLDGLGHVGEGKYFYTRLGRLHYPIPI